jgi:hypothetical protein
MSRPSGLRGTPPTAAKSPTLGDLDYVQHRRRRRRRNCEDFAAAAARYPTHAPTAAAAKS